MIKHALKEGIVHLSIDKKDFSHRIPVEKLGKAIQWNIGEEGSELISIKNVSKWMLRLMTQKITDEQSILHFKSIVQHYCPISNIDWKATLMAINIQNEFNSRMAAQKSSPYPLSQDEIIFLLEEKYELN